MYYEIGGNVLPKIRLADRATAQSPYVHPSGCKKEFILYLVVRGRLYLQEQDRQVVVSEGDMILLDAEYAQFGVSTSDCEYDYVCFQHAQMYRKYGSDIHQQVDTKSGMGDCFLEDSIDPYEDTLLIFPEYISFPSQEVFQGVAAHLRELIECYKSRQENYRLLCGCRLMELLVEASREGISREILHQTKKTSYAYERVQRLLRYLEENYGKSISGQIIEEEFACNFDYLNRIFKKYTGKTIFVYLNELRIRYAKEMLVTTSMKVAAVGYMVGYKDEGYFNKVFKKHTGTSPGQYERLALDESR